MLSGQLDGIVFHVFIRRASQETQPKSMIPTAHPFVFIIILEFGILLWSTAVIDGMGSIRNPLLSRG